MPWIGRSFWSRILNEASSFPKWAAMISCATPFLKHCASLHPERCKNKPLLWVVTSSKVRLNTMVGPTSHAEWNRPIAFRDDIKAIMLAAPASAPKRVTWK
ncbi:hypothetical protein CDAR_318411 [Caerostris darwini]|uniref:Uncharacterized protein n=1 Tax=Caerostris darwini TaxID=1538125 RepID=A0AAV4PU85_9ARAC|nr:hypothetical protein CDAR_318411 [Caerostris darwini]